jgi:hypothetical protein
MAEAARRRGWSRWAVETLAALCATALAVLLLAHLTGSPRAWLLLYDGDSVLPALIAGSVRADQGADWALSAVAFVPESAVYLALAAFGLSVQATLALNAIVNLLALYAALRLVAGTALGTRAGPSRAVLAVCAFAVFIGFGLLESSASRETLELATLLATTTYYSASVIATVVGVALLVRVVAPSRTEAAARRDAVVLTAVTALSVMTNPIVALWFGAPLLALAALALATRVARPRRVAAAVVALGAGGVIGALLRLPLSGLLTAGPGDKLDLAGSAASARYYGDLLAQRWNDGGWPVILAAALLMALGVAGTVVALRGGRLEPALVATASWLIPLVVVLGAIAVGTQSPRYLQPALFAPVLAMIAVPGSFARGTATVRGERMPAQRLAGPLALTVAAALIAVGTVSGASAARRLDAVDASVGCVVDWVEATGRTGVGTFWAVRAPKAYLTDQRRLVQVDARLDGYAWLVDRNDFAADRASFIVASAEGAAPAVPEGLPRPERIDCGRFTILDYGRAVLEIGPAHS